MFRKYVKVNLFRDITIDNYTLAAKDIKDETLINRLTYENATFDSYVLDQI